MKHGAVVTMLHAVYAGWLIALMVWMLPAAENGKLAVIVLMTWLNVRRMTVATTAAA
jgi:formate/nitrite transporter FocA (FNT family)